MMMSHEHWIPLQKLLVINRCHIFLKVYHISDLAYGSGTYITDNAWLGWTPMNSNKNLSWPKQGQPSKHDW